MLIEDGSGSGRKLKVDPHNRAVVMSDVRQMISHVSMVHGETYIGGSPIYTLPTNDEYRLMSFKNTKSGYGIVISAFYLYWNGGGVSIDSTATTALDFCAYGQQ